MKAKVLQGKASPTIRYRALALTSSLRQKDKLGEIQALWDFVRNRIRYVKDIRGIETIQDAEQTLVQASGDCDDKAILLDALLESIGHPTGLWAVGFKPGVFTHVIPITRLGPGNRWFPLETTEDKPWGWYPKGVQASLQRYN